MDLNPNCLQRTSSRIRRERAPVEEVPGAHAHVEVPVGHVPVVELDDLAALYRATNRVYNRRSIFCNLRDNAEDLDEILAMNFGEHSVEVVGSLALFTARG